jgi:hypothetical protein
MVYRRKVTVYCKNYINTLSSILMLNLAVYKSPLGFKRLKTI